MTFWQTSWKADPRGARIADRHYNRQKIGARQFVPPGRCVVLRHEDDALWITSHPLAQYVRHEWAGAWVNTMFRNESDRSLVRAHPRSGRGDARRLARPARARARDDGRPAQGPTQARPWTLLPPRRVRPRRDDERPRAHRPPSRPGGHAGAIAGASSRSRASMPLVTVTRRGHTGQERSGHASRSRVPRMVRTNGRTNGRIPYTRRDKSSSRATVDQPWTSMWISDGTMRPPPSAP